MQEDKVQGSVGVREITTRKKENSTVGNVLK